MEGAVESLLEYKLSRTALNPTERALIAREVDTMTARNLRQEGWTLAKLQREGDAALSKLGLSLESIALLRLSGRPAIPPGFLIPVLISNRFVCCICHDAQRPIIVHHIQAWARSHDHSPSNLAVLCELCHGRAHTRSELSRNLDAASILAAKKNWENKVKSEDAFAILEASRNNYAAWWYFNHLRLFELANVLNVPLRQYCRSAAKAGIATRNGILKSRDNRLSWMYEGWEGNQLYSYVVVVLNAVIEQLTIRNISDHLDICILNPILRKGDFIFVQGAHQFSPQGRRHAGVSQISAGRRRANNVEVQFRFDLWEATSSSAHGYLRGRRSVGSLVRIVDLSHTNGVFTITGSVLAIAAAFDGLSERDYGGAFPAGLIEWTEEDDIEF